MSEWIHDSGNTLAKDRLRFIPLAIALVLTGLTLGSNYASNNFERFPGWLMLLGILGCAAAIICDVIFLAIRVVRRQWRASVSVLLALAILVAGFYFRFEMGQQIDRARFAIFRDHYVSALKSAEDPTGSGLKIVSWGFWGYFMTGMFYRELVQDATNEISTPDAMKSARIRDALQAKIDEPLKPCSLSARGIEPHIYIVDIACR